MSDELYSAVDKVMAKIEVQVKKYKEKFSEHRHQGMDPAEFYTLGGPQITFSVVKDVPLHPLTREEAVTEMEKLGFNFWLFMDKNSKQMQVVFKRLDSTYGLLQPVKR